MKKPWGLPGIYGRLLDMWQLEFKHPYALLLLVPYALMIFWYLYGRVYGHDSVIAVSSEKIIDKRKTFRVRTYRYVPALRFLAILFLIIALARPGQGIHYSSIKNLGIDIMVVLDVSGSMAGEDFQPKNRLAVAKDVVRDFIKKRESDRIGMVIFAGEAYLQCPLTSEHDMLTDLADEIDFDSVSVDGTAIGDALALAASRMMDSKAKSRIILLITDGMNNRGTIDPETAAETCKDLGIKIYSVGIGSEGRVSYPNPGGFFGKRYLVNHFDPAMLEQASSLTGGKFYRATSSGVFWDNMKEINMLEKSEVDLKIYHEFYDKFEIFLILAVSLFFVEILMRSAYYRKIP